MFKRIIVDTESYPSWMLIGDRDSLQINDSSLLSCVYFVADEIVEVTTRSDQLNIFDASDVWGPIYATQEIRTEAGKRLSKRMERKHGRFVGVQKQYSIKENKELKYISYNSEDPLSAQEAIFWQRDGGLLLSRSKRLKWASLIGQKKSANSAILALAMAGIELSLPNICFNLHRREEYLTVKQKLDEERLAYLVAISKYAEEAFERLKSSPDTDTVEWALDQAAMKIRPRVIDLELAIKKLNTSLIKRLATDLVVEGLPVIGSTMAGGGKPVDKASLLAKILSILSKQLARERIEDMYPDAIYQLKISDELT